MMTNDAERSAAEACLAVITQHFVNGDIPVEYINAEDPSKVAGFLLGQLIATITDLSELTGIEPLEYVHVRAMQLALDANG